MMPFSRVQEITVTDSADGQRIDNYLFKILKGVPKSKVYRILRKGEVRINKGRVKPHYHLHSGDLMRIPPIRVAEREEPNPGKDQLNRIQRSIILEDSNYIFLNKPSGLAVHGGSGLSFGIIEGLRVLRPDADFLELGHRLDRETSGVLLIAKKRSALRAFQQLMQEGACEKIYQALVKGVWKIKEPKVDLPLLKNTLKSGERLVRVDRQGKQAISWFRPLESFKDATLMQIRLETGRTHQIRVHAQYLRHPIAGDPKYGDEPFNREMKNFGLKRLFLHASSLRFTLAGEQTYAIEAPLIQDLHSCLQQLESL